MKLSIIDVIIYFSVGRFINDIIHILPVHCVLQVTSGIFLCILFVIKNYEKRNKEEKP